MEKLPQDVKLLHRARAELQDARNMLRGTEDLAANTLVDECVRQAMVYMQDVINRMTPPVA